MTEGPDENASLSEAINLPIAETKELFVTMGKAIRAFQLYDENNPVYQRFVQALSSAFVGLWEHSQSLTIAIEEERLTLDGIEVYFNPSRSESLSFLLYKDGIRTLTFMEGLEKETEQLLKVMNTARHARTDGDDLLTLLWEADLAALRYRYVDLLAEGVELPESGQGSTQQEMEEVLDEVTADGQLAEKQESPQSVSRDDFNPTLYALDPAEMERLKQEVRKEQERDTRGAVLDALFDRLEEPDPKRQNEILDILRVLLPAFLARGELVAATVVLSEVRRLEGSGPHFGPDQRNQATELLNQASSSGTVFELVRALEDGALDPTPEELGAFLANLRAGALGALLKASENVDSRELQPILRQAVVNIAERNEMALVGLLAHDDPQVAAAAARLVGRNKVSAAIDGLLELLYHGDAQVRLAAVEAALALRASTAAGPLQDVLLDSVTEVRVAAARALGELKYGPAAGRLRQVIESKEIRNAEITERIAMFEAYGSIGDPAAFELLDKLLNSKGFLGRREPAEIRACAALALGKLRTPASRESLIRASKDDDPVVRSAVGRAIRGQEAAGGSR